MRGLIFFYLLIAFGILLVNRNLSSKNSNQYKVEINRIYAGFVENNITEPDTMNFQWQKVSQAFQYSQPYQYVQDVEFISLDERDAQKIAAFYKTTGEYHMEIRPYYIKSSLLGYLRFDYTIGEANQFRLFYIELALFLIVSVVISILLYIRHQILKPFHTLSDFPYELSKGHLQGEMKETPNRYFGKFVWGLGLLQDKLLSTKNKALELEKQKKLMLLSLSHDIKTPLSTIQLYSKALAEDLYETEDKKKEAARQIGEKTVEIERFVSEIMKASSEDIIDIEVEQHDFYLNTLVEKLKSTYNEKCRLQLISFHIGTYENKLLHGDLEHIFEVIGNIIENAMKYGDGKNISITFPEEDYCQLIRIYNSGIPVKDNEFNHLFDSFFRGSNSEGKPGNGLGLYIGKRIMQKMEGELFAERETCGMSFTLVIKE